MRFKIKLGYIKVTNKAISMTRQFSLFDKLIGSFDQALRTLTHNFKSSQPTRNNPMHYIKYDSSRLTNSDIRRVVGLMRINHTGEVCAQALYLGQALTTPNETLKASFHQAANEEYDHLHWCQERLNILNGKSSRLNPIWYAGAFVMGAFASQCGDKWSLGFLHETEQQVVAHLKSHLEKLPENDLASRAIINQMILDEESHAQSATHLGAAALPFPIPKLMKFTAKIMTRIAYYV